MRKNQSKNKKDFHNKPYPAANSDFVRKQRTFGIPVDPRLFDIENLNPLLAKSTSSFHAAFYQAVSGLTHNDPLSALLQQEEDEINEQVKELIGEWLPQALERLPYNQRICISLRFRFDNPEDKTLRPEQEISEIVALTQQWVSKYILSGIENLKTDYKANLEPVIKKLKS